MSRPPRKEVIMTFFDDPILPQTPKMQELSDIIKRSHETGQDYQAIKHLIDQSSLTANWIKSLQTDLPLAH